MTGHPTLHASAADLIGWRMAALGLWRTLPGAHEGGGEDRITAVVDGLLALQGQDWNAARWALGLRAPGTVESDVVAAFDSGALVRSWPMRGTIHVLAAEDIGWMQRATNRRVLAGAQKRRDYLGLDDGTLARMVDIAVDRMVGGRSLSRDELGAAWTEAGIGAPEKGVGQWRYHVVWWLCQNDIAVPGPVSTAGATDAAGGATIGEPRLMLTDEWIRAHRSLEGDEALAELAARFAAGRGPVQDKDLAWWTGLTRREARRGIAAAESEKRLAPVMVEGSTYWADPRLLESGAGPAMPETDGALLLPGFDEHLLGYTDRTAMLNAAHFDRLVPGRNGVFRATVVDERGRATGTWMRTPRAQRTRIEVEAFPGETLELERLRGPAEAWGAFRGVEVELIAP